MIYVYNIHQYVECLFKLISCDSIFCSKYFNLGNILVGSVEVKTCFNICLHVCHANITALIHPETLNACYNLGNCNAFSRVLGIQQLLMDYVWTALIVLF